MNDPASPVARACRRRPLAGCFASIFALSAPAVAIADTWIVTSCDEGSSGDNTKWTGTLRYALQNAVSPAVIDMTGLTGFGACLNSRISLTTGALTTSLDSVTIIGPGLFTGLTIDASSMPSFEPGLYRVLEHHGAGTLTLKNIGVSGGHVYQPNNVPTYGGCILSSGSVVLEYASVSNCLLRNYVSYFSAGGGISANGTVTMTSSSVSGNIVHGVFGKALGGGVFAKGDVVAGFSSIDGNQAYTLTDRASGGAIYTQGNLSLSFSFLTANAISGSKAFGGGVHASGNATFLHSFARMNQATGAGGYGGAADVDGLLEMRFSYIAHNLAHDFALSGLYTSRGGGATAGTILSDYTTLDGNGATGYRGTGGALFSPGNATIRNSTISNNYADYRSGGLHFFGGEPFHKTVTITNSTISGNRSSYLVGGMFADAAKVSISNSTIAFNYATEGMLVGEYIAPGVTLLPQGAGAITLSGSILSNNFSASGMDDDFALTQVDLPISGFNNLVFAAHATLPNDTFVATCPLLGPLRYNGGYTSTHALASNSPAIDTGYAPPGPPGGDERGNGYARVSGTQADIGAYELQQDEIIFYTGLEGCPEL